jgi:hypothetical protein
LPLKETFDGKFLPVLFIGVDRHSEQ